MMLLNCTVTACMAGGPAALSKKIDKGDTIVKVDDISVSRETVISARNLSLVAFR